MVLSAILGAAAGTIGKMAGRGTDVMGSPLVKAGGDAAAAAVKPVQKYSHDSGASLAQNFDTATGKDLRPQYRDPITQRFAKRPEVPGAGEGAKAAKGGGDIGNIMTEFKKLMPGGGGKELPENWKQLLAQGDAKAKEEKQRARYQKMLGEQSTSVGAKMQKGMKTMGGKAGMLGISASVSSLMRQSQLFTGIMGAFFQVVGAFIDVLLAPFMPGLFKMVAMLAKAIPWVQTFSKGLFSILETYLFKPIGFVIASVIVPWYKLVFKMTGWIWGTLWKIVQWGFNKLGEAGKWLMGLDKMVTDWVFNAIKSLWNWITWWSGPLHPFKKMFSVISGIIGFVIDIIKGVWDWLKELPFTIGEFFISIKNKLVEIWDGITGWLGDVFSATWDAIKTAVDWVGGAFKTGWSAIKAVFEWLGGAFQTGWTIIKDALSWVWDKGKLVFTWYTDTLKMVLNFYMSALAWVWDTGKLAWAWIVDTVKKGWNTLVSAGEWVWGAFKTGWTTIKDWVVGAFKTAWEAMKATAEWISGAFKTAWEGLKDGLSWIWGTFKTAWEGMKAGLTWIGSGFKDAWITLKGWVGDVKDVLIDKVKRVAVWLWTTGKGFLKFYKDLLIKIGGYIIGGFFTMKDLVYKYIVQPLGRMWDWITTKPWAFIQDVFDMLVEKVKAFFSFDWLKVGLVAILGFLEKVFNALGGIGLDLGFKKIMPFGALSNLGSTMQDLVNAIESSRTGTGGTTENVLRIKIDTNGGLGMPDLTSQQVFSLKHAEAEIILNTIRLETDADSSGNSVYMSGLYHNSY